MIGSINGDITRNEGLELGVVEEAPDGIAGGEEEDSTESGEE
jgi:hypothetical protein